jgi:hypothetical protein
MKGAYFFEKRFQLEQRNEDPKMMLCLPLFLEIEEKSGLLLTVTAKMLQKHGLSRVSSNSARPTYVRANTLKNKFALFQIRGDRTSGGHKLGITSLSLPVFTGT